MATRTSARIDVQGSVDVIEWTGLLAGDDGDWRLFARYPDKSIHVFGTFGGATVRFQGTHETDTKVNPVNLRSASETVIGIVTATDIKQILENPLYCRPLIVGGDGTTSLTVRLVCK